MSDIRELLSDASADIEVGPADPVGLVRQGLARRRRRQAAVVGVAAAVATAISVPVAVARSSKSTEASVGPARTFAAVDLYQVVHGGGSAQHSLSVEIDGRQLQIRRRPALELHATNAAVRHTSGGWEVLVAGPELTRLHALEANSAASPPPSFVALLDGGAYRATSVDIGHLRAVALRYFGTKQRAITVAGGIAPLVSVPMSVTMQECVPPAPHCRRLIKEFERRARAGH